MSNAMTLWLLRLGLTALGGMGALWLTRGEESGPGKCLRGLIFAAPWGAGGYYTVFWALGGLVAWGYLIWWSRGRNIVIRGSLGAAMVGITAVLYGLGPIWAADRGSALLALGRAPALLAVALLMMQEENRSCLELLPLSGAAITAVSIPLSFLPKISQLVSWRGRLCGTFEYANSFALFLLVGLMVSWSRKTSGAKAWCVELLLTLGILLSGSRTTFLLLGGSLLVLWMVRRSGRFCLETLGAILGALVLSRLYQLGSETASAAGRVLATGAGDSSFLTRVLYWKDAIPVILRHPLGLGYLGYRAIQGSIQHGVYHVAYVHNSLMQLVLDAGWLPGVLLVAALIRSFFRAGAEKRLMILVCAAHGMMEFDLEFFSLWLVLLCLLDLDRGREIPVRPGPALAALGLLVGVGGYLALGDTLYHLGSYEDCLRLIPWHTQALRSTMGAEEDVTAREALADRVLRLNPYAADAWEVKAQGAQKSGNLQAMMAYSQQVLENRPYDRSAYEAYFDRLWEAYQRYDRAGNRRDREICRTALLALPERMDQVKRGSDPLAFRIQHRPELNLGPGYQRILRQLWRQH